MKRSPIPTTNAGTGGNAVAGDRDGAVAPAYSHPRQRERTVMPARMTSTGYRVFGPGRWRRVLSAVLRILAALAPAVAEDAALGGAEPIRVRATRRPRR